MKTKLLLAVFLLSSVLVWSKEYNASFFGIKSDGVTLNTSSIQAGIDYIHKEGGGVLVFNVGRYLTGSIELKSNVSILLKEGAVLLGSLNPFDYNIEETCYSMIRAVNQKNISIYGKGVIDAQGRQVSYNIIDLVYKGLIKDPLDYDRPRRPRGLHFKQCQNIVIDGITIKNTSDWTQEYEECDSLRVNGITVNNTAYWNNDGIDIVDCEDVLIENSFFNASDDGICLKSHNDNSACRNVIIRNCTIRSSANGIKFGTMTVGGYENIRIINNRVYDTYRSAFTIAVPDGGYARNIVVDSLQAYNTGNALFLRIGNRTHSNKIGSMDSIFISNLYVEIPEGKPDAGYEYEGPIEHMPRNVSPASIIGLKGHLITNVRLKNVIINHPGAGKKEIAEVGLTPQDLDGIPEREDSYPEFSCFKELPAWGLYMRHVKQIAFENVVFVARKRDYRPAVVLDDAHDVNIKDVKVQEPGTKKKQIHMYKSSNVVK